MFQEFRRRSIATHGPAPSRPSVQDHVEGHQAADLAPKHEEHAELLEWVGGRYDAEEFDPARVVFDDPKQRLEFMLS